MSAVTVLCPNGRRVTVKVGPNTTILQIIDQACAKYGYTPEEFDLKHLKRILKPDSTVRFESVPNNSQLELVPSDRRRKESPVTLVIQLPSGQRLNGEYPSDATLHDVISDLRAKNLDNQEINVDSDKIEIVLLYIRSEVAESAAKLTTLRSLGLTGGKALIRLLHKPKNASSELTCVGGVLQKPERESQAAQKFSEEPRPRRAEEPSKDENIPQTKSEVEGPSGKEVNNESSPLPEQKVTKMTRIIESMDVDQVKEEKTVTPDAAESPKDEGSLRGSHPSAVEPEPKSLVKEEPLKEDEAMSVVEEQEDGTIFPLGERDALLFNKNEVSSTVRYNVDEEDFFDVTMEDIKLLHKDLVRKRKEAEQESELSLLTAELRMRKAEALAAQQEADRLARLHRYPKTTIRINFPAPDYLVLQAVFRSVETVESVIEFAKKYMNEERPDLYLYTSPPKQVLDPSKRLFELDLPPGASVYVSVTEEKAELRETFWLTQETREKVSSFSAAVRVAEQARRSDRADRPIRTGDNAGSHVDQSFAPPSNVLERLRNQEVRTRPTNSNSSPVPKWFKSQK